MLSDKRLDRKLVDMRYILFYACSYFESEETELVDQLVNMYDVDPNDDEYLFYAAQKRYNNIIRVLISHPKMCVKTLTCTIKRILSEMEFYKTVKILLYSPLDLSVSVSWMIKKTINNPQMATEILRKHWENNDDVPIHWRFFYSLFSIFQPCAYDGYHLHTGRSQFFFHHVVPSCQL